MSQWVRKGLRTGIKTTRYPASAERAVGVSPGRPLGGVDITGRASPLAKRCPTGAIKQSDHSLIVDYRHCVHCFRCARGMPLPIRWEYGYEWASAERADTHGPLKNGFKHSIHIIVVDAGDCGACLNEVKQLNNPYYNMHRLGFFLTPTPRQADVLIVVGPVTDHMRSPLEKTYNAMPAPKQVIAVGACAISGGVFGPTFTTGAGAAAVIPVDIEVPGNPPPPLAILHALLVAVGRKPSASLLSPAARTTEASAR